ncbi:MAG: FkbM family methyltransferase [Actinomycetota bacterium]
MTGRSSPSFVSKTVSVVLRWVPVSLKRAILRLPGTARIRERMYRGMGEQVVPVSGFDLVLSIDMRSATQRIYSTAKHEEQYVVDFLTQQVRPGGYALDIGAFIGFYTILLGSLVGHEGRVWAFEPVPECARRVETNASLNGLSHVRVETAAVSNINGETTLTLGIDPSSGHIGPTSSLARPGSKGSLPVAVCRIDDYVVQHPFDRLDLVKIDVEGAEVAALEGMHETLRSFRPTLLVEVNDTETRESVSAELRRSQYDIQTIGSSGHGAHLVARPLPSDPLRSYFR